MVLLHNWKNLLSLKTGVNLPNRQLCLEHASAVSLGVKLRDGRSVTCSNAAEASSFDMSSYLVFHAVSFKGFAF